MLIKIACKLTQDHKSPKQKEALVDVEQLEISLDVPSEKTHSRRSETMEISLNNIRKVLDDVKEENENEDIRVMI